MDLFRGLYKGPEKVEEVEEVEESPNPQALWVLNLLLNLAVPIALATVAQMFLLCVNDLDLSIGAFVSLVACIADGYKVTMEQYIQWRGRKLAFCDSVWPLFEKYDLLLTPSLSVAAFPVNRLNPEHWPQHVWDWLPWASFSYPFNFTGQPASSVPCGFTPAGLPVGLQLVGRLRDDLTVLQASAAFEKARPWADRRPALD